MVDATWVDALRLQFFAPGQRKNTWAANSRADIRFYDLHQAVLRVRDSGQSAAQPGWPTVVLVCDPPNVLEHFDELFAIGGNHCRLVCFEPPGFGFSRPSPRFRFTFPEYLSCVEELLNALNAGPYVLAFTCVWAHIALQLATKKNSDIRSLMLWQSPSWAEQVKWSRFVDPKRMLSRPFIGQASLAIAPAKVALEWYNIALHPNRHSNFFPVLQEALHQGAFCCLGSLWQQWFQGYAPPPISVTQPVLITWGEADFTHRHTNKGSLAGEIANVTERDFFKQAGHSPELEVSEQFFALLKDWIHGTDSP